MAGRARALVVVALVGIVCACGGGPSGQDATQPDAGEDWSWPDPGATDLGTPDVNPEGLDVALEAVDALPDADAAPELAPDVCQPACGDKVCGNDGCGGSCGGCAAGSACVQGACVALPGCGDDACVAEEGEDCDTCLDDCPCTGCGEVCDGGACRFAACDQRECGDDDCGGSCGTCDERHFCDQGTCAFLPYCGDGACNAEGETCETCAEDCACGCGEVCEAGACRFSACDGRTCVPDGCGGVCGVCAEGETCTHDRCIDYDDTFYLTPTVGADIASVNDMVARLGTGGQHLVVGAAFDVFYMDQTAGPEGDWAFDPAQALEPAFAVSEATGVPAFFHLNGGPWMTSGASANRGRELWSALKDDPAEVMWDQANQPLANPTWADGHFFLTLSRDEAFDDQATRHRRYKKRNLQQAVVHILAWAAEHPELFVAVGTDSEVSQHTYAADAAYADSLSDYSPASIREFRAWLAQRWGDDIVAFRDAMGASGASNWQSFASDGDGIDGPDIDPPRDLACIDQAGCACQAAAGHPLVKNCSAYWDEWTRFRAYQVDQIVEDTVRWIREAGVPAGRVFAHQIPEKDPSHNHHRRFASPLYAAAPHFGSCGVTTYDADAADVDLFARLAVRCRDWAALEYNPVHAAQGQAASFDEAAQALRAVRQAGAHLMAPWAWAVGGDYAFYAIADNPFELALAAFVSEWADQPREPLADTLPPGTLPAVPDRRLLALDRPAHRGIERAQGVVAGWAIDDRDVAGVDVVFDGGALTLSDLDAGEGRFDVDRTIFSPLSGIPALAVDLRYSGNHAGFSTPFDPLALGEGPHWARAYVRDGAGNVAPLDDAVFTVDDLFLGDTTAPDQGALDEPALPHQVVCGPAQQVRGWVLDGQTGVVDRVGVVLTRGAEGQAPGARRFAGWLTHGWLRPDLHDAGHSGVDCESRDACAAGFAGTIDLSGFEPGPYRLEVVAFDRDGNAWSSWRAVEVGACESSAPLPWPARDAWALKAIQPDFWPNADEISGNGAGGVAMNLVWSEWEPARKAPPCAFGEEAFDGHCFRVPAATDAAIRDWSARGLYVVGVVYGVPEWARIAACSPASPGFEIFCAAKDPADYARFAGYLAWRYGGLRGLGRVADFVVHNEVNANDWYDVGCGQGTPCDAEAWIARYAADWNAAYDRIVAYQAHARVLVPFTHHFEPELDAPAAANPLLSLKSFLGGFAPRVGSREWRVAYHPYPPDLLCPGFGPLDFPRVTYGNIGALAGWLRAAFPADPHAWEMALTESGVNSLGPCSSPEAQAEGVCRSLAAALGTPGIDTYVYHRMQDHPDEVAQGLGVGLWDSAGVAKPAWSTWALANRRDLAPPQVACGFEHLPYTRLVRGSSLAQGHWATTRLLPEGVTEENSWRLLREAAPGTHLLYECLAGGDSFVSPDPSCEGQRPMGPLGWAYDAAVDGAIPLYRCNTGSDHFVSPDVFCEGEAAESLLGYVLP